MQLIIFCALLGMALGAFAPQQFKAGSVGVLKKAVDVSTLASGYRSSARASDTCPQECQPKVSDFEDVDDPAVIEYNKKQNSPYRFQGQFNPTMLNRECRTWNKVISCVKRCPASAAKDQELEDLVIKKYKCADTEFLQHAACYMRVNDEMLSSCTSKCSSQRSAVENAGPITSMEDIERMLRDNCAYFKCDSLCDNKKVVQECGADAARIMLGYYKANTDFLKTYLGRMGVTMPSSCNAVGRSDE